MDIILDMISGIKTYVQSKIDNAQYALIKTGIITEYSNDSYTIKIDGVNYYNIESASESIYPINKTVRVFVVNNNYEDIFIL